MIVNGVVENLLAGIIYTFCVTLLPAAFVFIAFGKFKKRLGRLMTAVEYLRQRRDGAVSGVLAAEIPEKLLPMLQNYEKTANTLRMRADKIGVKFPIRADGSPRRFAANDWEGLVKFLKSLESYPKNNVISFLRHRKEWKHLFNELESMIEQIEFACVYPELNLRNDFQWFEERWKLLDRDGFEHYHQDERPKSMAEQLRQILNREKPEGSRRKHVLFVEFPWGWEVFRKAFLAAEPGAEDPAVFGSVFYKWDYRTGDIFKYDGGDIWKDDSWHTEEQFNNIHFDVVVCWHFMQHCAKICSKFYFRNIADYLAENGLLVLFLAVSRYPRVDTIAVEGCCEYSSFLLKNLRPQVRLDLERLEMSFAEVSDTLQLTPVKEHDGQLSPCAWSICDSRSEYGFLLKLQDDYVICWKRSEDVIRQGMQLADEAAEVLRFTEDAERAPARIELKILPGKPGNASGGQVVLQFLGVHFLCYPYVPAADMEDVPGVARDIAGALRRQIPLPYPAIAETVFDPYFEHIDWNAYGENRMRFVGDGGGELLLRIFLNKHEAPDAGGYIGLGWEGKWYVTYFPMTTLMTEEAARRKLAETHTWCSVTHQISETTLFRTRLADIRCRFEGIWYHTLGPGARFRVEKEDLRELENLRKRKDRTKKPEDRTKKQLFSELTDLLNDMPPEKRDRKLLEWNVHDALVLGRRGSRRRK